MFKRRFKKILSYLYTKYFGSNFKEKLLDYEVIISLGGSSFIFEKKNTIANYYRIYNNTKCRNLKAMNCFWC